MAEVAGVTYYVLQPTDIAEMVVNRIRSLEQQYFTWYMEVTEAEAAGKFASEDQRKAVERHVEQLRLQMDELDCRITALRGLTNELDEPKHE